MLCFIRHVRIKKVKEHEQEQEQEEEHEQFLLTDAQLC